MRFLIVLLGIMISICGVAQENQKDAKGRKQGPWSKTYPKSRVYEYKGQFKDDKPVGTFTYFYPSTKVKAVITHEETTGRSVAVFYHENGTVMSKGIYRNLKKDSIWLNFTPSGRLSTSETYKNDVLNGKKIVYFVPEDVNDKSRIVSAVYNYENGKLQGEMIEYFVNGTIKCKGFYKDNKKEGIWESYHANGKKMMFERYKNGARHGWCYAYDTTGKEIGKEYFYFGRRLQGKELQDRLKQCKEKGIDPNQ